MKIILVPLLATALILLAIPSTLVPSVSPAQASRLNTNPGNAPSLQAPLTATYTLYFPLVSTTTVDPCAAIPNQSYGSVPINGSPTDRPAAEHPDINLSIRGWAITNAYKGLVDYAGPSDPSAPQLAGLFTDNRVPVFRNVYQVYSWDWNCNCRGGLITDPPVTLTGMAVVPAEIIDLPGSGYPISRPLLPSSFSAMVLYATTDRVTLKYTRDDNVVYGYTIHIEGICVEPSLRALYKYWNAAGRSQLPALYAFQPIGRAKGSEIGVAIRDNGSFMDPRSRKDWWQGR